MFVYAHAKKSKYNIHSEQNESIKLMNVYWFNFTYLSKSKWWEASWKYDHSSQHPYWLRFWFKRVMRLWLLFVCVCVCVNWASFNHVFRISELTCCKAHWNTCTCIQYTCRFNHLVIIQINDSKTYGVLIVVILVINNNRCIFRSINCELK